MLRSGPVSINCTDRPYLVLHHFERDFVSAGVLRSRCLALQKLQADFDILADRDFSGVPRESDLAL